jgi:hypothetical protein
MAGLADTLFTPTLQSIALSFTIPQVSIARSNTHTPPRLFARRTRQFHIVYALRFFIFWLAEVKRIRRDTARVWLCGSRCRRVVYTFETTAPMVEDDYCTHAG